MLDSAALIAMACLIANNNESNAQAKLNELSREEQQQVLEVLEGGNLLPASIECLIEKTNNDVAAGNLNEIAGGQLPTRDCY